jgi:tetratricopeptide (TPR) repeat protein
MVNCLKNLCRVEEALSLLNEHLQIQPNSHEALLLKGMTLSDQSTYCIDSEKYNEAIMTFDQVLKLNDRKFNTKALEQMIKSRICERDFYSAYHLI